MTADIKPVACERRAFYLDALSAAEVKRTNRSSHVVWQIVSGEWKIQGPPVEFRGGWISGPAGWKTKREAVAALRELRESAARAQQEAEGNHGQGR